MFCNKSSLAWSHNFIYTSTKGTAKSRVLAIPLESYSMDWLSLALTISMPNSQRSWEFHEKECEQSSDSTDVVSMCGLALTWRNVSDRSTFSKFSAIPCFLWKTRNQSTEHEKLTLTGTIPCILICQNPVLAAINLFDAPLIAKHNTTANVESSGFISASAYTKHLNTVDFWSDLLKIPLQNFGWSLFVDVNKEDSEKFLSSY